MLPGPKTKMWTYGGTFPGPTIRRPAGQPTGRHLRPPAAAEGRRAHAFTSTAATTAPPRTASPAGSRRASRGRSTAGSRTGSRPRDSGNDLLIEPGGERTYRYDLIEDGGPERAAFQWYHDHRLERTAQTSGRGSPG